MKRLFVLLVAFALAGCSQYAGAPTAVAPSVALAPGAEPDVAFGIYVSIRYGLSIFGFQPVNRANDPPFCFLLGVASYNIAVDGNGNLFAPDFLHDQIYVFRGPGMCGPGVKSIVDPYGPPTDAAGPDALHGTFVVVHTTGFTSGSPGGAELCSLSAGCTQPLAGSAEHLVGGVVMANNGDCWESALTKAHKAKIIYFQACSKAGVAASNFANASQGGLDIDDAGNLVAISARDAKLYVYRGCDPACTRIGGPFRLRGAPFYGHLNQTSTRLAVADTRNGLVDIYAYSPKRVRFLYSFGKGLTGSQVVSGIAFNPRSRE
ncbi:MAG: hypothetical protein WAJ94_12775 [Candidatus Cybelea sp.]